MKLKLLLVAALVMSPLSFAQSPMCNNEVYDGANLFKSQAPSVQQAAEGLVNTGATVRIWSVPANQNLDSQESSIERTCSSWRSPNGARRANLIALMVSPSGSGFKGHVGVYYGTDWHKALDNDWNRIKQDYMLPNFKAGDFAAGMTATANQFSKRIKAAEDEAQHPVTTVVIPPQQAPQAPTDYSGLWKLLGWLLGICVFVGALVFLLKRLSERGQRREERTAAQRAAIGSRDRVVELLDEIRTKAPSQYDDFSQQYSRLAGSIKNDPDQAGLSKGEYNAINDVYRGMYMRMSPIVNPVPLSPPPPAAPPVDTSTHTAKSKNHSHGKYPQPTPSPTTNTVVVHDNSSNFVDGLVLGSVLDRVEEPRYRAPEPEPYREPEHRREPEPDPAPSWSSPSDSGGGGSSDFSSSSSDSSSGSDFGGSSDFGSSSSGDSGGGGSSDF
jgi:uncharacterized membrane protein YgcG